MALLEESLSAVSRPPGRSANRKLNNYSVLRARTVVRTRQTPGLSIGSGLAKCKSGAHGTAPGGARHYCSIDATSPHGCDAWARAVRATGCRSGATQPRRFSDSQFAATQAPAAHPIAVPPAEPARGRPGPRSSALPPGKHLGGHRRGTGLRQDRKSTRLNSSHVRISYAVFCLKKKKR